MHINSVYTSSFVLPDFPLVENLLFTSLCPGSDGRFGFVVCLMPHNYGTFAGQIMDFPLAMLIIDVENAQVEEHRVSFAYKAFYNINLNYYAEQSAWLLAVDATRDGGPIVQKLLDFYVVDSSTSPPGLSPHVLCSPPHRGIENAMMYL
ncbi:hypothetical protein KSC_005180 [Ktedonobacter sp. SOSP1-52]|uniref:hypothetical protein n=1 Tax=Ktedonobacter sp. SOSP1-52 TaxID=2778366 RepID=UPI001914EB38|nr:hypothetical protein [Ktedonobacter sp. SOSP1-52]GHO61626.1 hypothetical protein KSC_005180 [Ktedonobacter sp. SOSP1-52]